MQLGEPIMQRGEPHLTRWRADLTCWSTGLDCRLHSIRLSDPLDPTVSRTRCDRHVHTIRRAGQQTCRDDDLTRIAQ